MFLFTFLSAQIRITGTVKDASGEEALIGVTVWVEGTNGIGTVTNAKGRFSLKVPSRESILIFSYIGYKEQKVAIKKKRRINVFMAVEMEDLEMVTVTALGIKRQTRSIGYSTETIKGEELVTSNAENIVTSLTGKVAGLQVTTPNGVDGGTTRFIIRGNNNIVGDNQPLVVVDNVPIANDPGMTDIGRGKDWGSAINNLNPEDIENVTILKGPTASSLYGSRGGNGVILISTKDGVAGETKFNYNTYFGIKTVS